MHDTRIGRFFAVDPLAGKYPHNSPYAFSENRVIDGVELEGLEYANSHQQWMGAFRDSMIQLAGAKDNFGAQIGVHISKIIKFFDKENLISGKIVYLQEVVVRPKLKESLNAIKYDSKADVNFIDIEYNDELTKEYSGEVFTKGFGLEVVDKTNLKTNEKSTEVKGSYGVNGNGAYVNTEVNHKTGETKTRVGIEAKIEFEISDDVSNEFGADASLGQ